MLFEPLSEIALRIGEVGARERDDLLIAQILDADILHRRKWAILRYCQEIPLMRDREEPQGADVLHRPDEAEVELAGLDTADDVARVAAGDMHADIRTLPGNLRQEGWQDTDGGRIDGADPDLP